MPVLPQDQTFRSECAEYNCAGLCHLVSLEMLMRSLSSEELVGLYLVMELITSKHTNGPFEIA